MQKYEEFGRLGWACESFGLARQNNTRFSLQCYTGQMSKRDYINTCYSYPKYAAFAENSYLTLKLYSCYLRRVIDTIRIGSCLGL